MSDTDWSGRATSAACHLHPKGTPTLPLQAVMQDPCFLIVDPTPAPVKWRPEVLGLMLTPAGRCSGLITLATDPESMAARITTFSSVAMISSSPSLSSSHSCNSISSWARRALMFLISASTVRASSGKCMWNMLGEDPLNFAAAWSLFVAFWSLWVFLLKLFEARPLMGP